MDRRKGPPLRAVTTPWTNRRRAATRRQILLEFFQASPLAEVMADGSVSFERDQDSLREIEL
jgi:hypothetical protein